MVNILKPSFRFSFKTKLCQYKTESGLLVLWRFLKEHWMSIWRFLKKTLDVDMAVFQRTLDIDYVIKRWHVVSFYDNNLQGEWL